MYSFAAIVREFLPTHVSCCTATASRQERTKWIIERYAEVWPLQNDVYKHRAQTTLSEALPLPSLCILQQS